MLSATEELLPAPVLDTPGTDDKETASASALQHGQGPPEVRVGVITSSSVLGTGLVVMVEQVPFVHQTGRPAPDRLSLMAYDLLIVDDDSVGVLPSGVSPRVMVALASAHDAQNALAPQISNGVDGYIEMGNLSATSLAEAIRQCLLGEYPVPPSMVRTLIRGGGRTPGGGLSSAITAREKEALQHIADGLSNEQVARHLGISAHGVKRLVASVMVKLDAPNRTSAVIKAITAGVLDCPSHHCTARH